MLRHANRRQASLLISLLCLNSALFTSVLTACGSGDTCSQCDGGSGGMGNGGSAGDASGGSAGASTGGSGDASANVVAYCDCMLNSCHDEYHATWGEDHIVAEAQCHAEAGMVPENGSRRSLGTSSSVVSPRASVRDRTRMPAPPPSVGMSAPLPELGVASRVFPAVEAR